MQNRRAILISVSAISLGALIFIVIYAMRIPRELSDAKIITTEYNYLALGDSYTIGESVKKNQTWPILLANGLSNKAMLINSTTIIAKTGWRTDEMLAVAEKKIESKKFEMVSLLIGANNEFQGQGPSDFENEFIACLTYAIAHCRNGNDGVFVLSIPDYGYTPYGKSSQKRISKRIDQYNEICERIAKSYQVAYYNITPTSRKGLIQSNLVAKDGLHPSGEQYELWAEQITNNVYHQFNLYKTDK